MEKSSKQVIIMRKDLNMRKGKMVAQGAHASLSAFMASKDDSAMKDWLANGVTKICVSVNSEAELIEIFNKAKSKGLACALITDAGRTEFNGVPTKTCCAIGPNWADEIDPITNKLSLL